MVSIDAMLAELRAKPAAERDGWTVCYALSRLDPEPDPPSVPVPDWFAGAVAGAIRQLATRWMQSPVFPGIRRLERLGVLTLEHDDAYVLAMVSALGDRWDPLPRLDAIRRDDELRESLLWRVFEVEGGGEISLANVDKFSRPGATWAECFRILVTEGTLDRHRVLMSCLQALGQDFSAYRAGFFSQLYVKLAPTVDEVISCQARLLRLLRATVPATAAFAVRQLVVVDTSGALDDEEFVAMCPAALTLPAKGTPITVIDLAARMARRRPDLTAQVAQAVAGGLEHRHRDVQIRAVDLLRRLDAPELVAGRLELLEPTVARMAADWLGTPMGGLERARASERHPQQVVARHPRRPLIEDRTAAERAAALLAGETDPWEIELLLATIAAGAARDELAALAKPARKALRHDWSLRRNISAVLVGADLDVRGNILAGRLREVLSVRTGTTKPGVLLATPTDRSGWLDPREFVTRLSVRDGEPAHHDLVAALLRLHQDGRGQALRAARNLPGDAGAAARYALGGPPAPIGDPAVWVAAARSRAPLDDDPHLVAAGLDGAGQGYAARFELRLTPSSRRYDAGGQWRTVTFWAPALAVHPGADATASDQPTVLAPYGPTFSERYRGSGFGRDWLPWAAQIWPHDAEPFFAAEIGEVMGAAYEDVSYRTPEILDALLTHPGRLGPMAASVLAAGLTTTEIGNRARSADAFATLVPAGRLDFETLAAAMADLAGHATATRWAAALRASGATQAVVEVLGRLLPRLPRDHRGLHALLATLHEESVRAGGVPVDDVLRTWLAGFTGSSKAAKTARAILAEQDGSP